MMDFNSYIHKLEGFRIDRTETDPERIDSHLPFLKQLDMVDKSSVALFDMSTMGYRFLTEKFRFLLGLDPDEAAGTGIDYFTERMNREDLNLFFDTSIRSFEFLMAQPPEDRKMYKTCQDFRIRRADEQWVRILQQNIVLELGSAGNIWLVLIINDLSPLRDRDIPSRRYMEHLPTGKRVLFSEDDANAGSPISPRELEVLGLIARGYASRDIADFLGISIATVNNHRQHILEKLEVANTAEAVNFAKDLNLIECD